MPIRNDSSVQQLIKNPPVFARVAKLIASKNGQTPEAVQEKLTVMAPDLIFGLFITLTEFLALDISLDELNTALDEI